MEERTGLSDLEVITVTAEHLTESQRAAMHRLQVQCFSDVPYQELMEDFVAASIAKVLASYEGELVGCVSVFKRTIECRGRTVMLGGFGGTCTRADFRRRGIGSAVCSAAMDLLREEGCDVAFLAVGEKSGTAAFYQRLGFVLLEKPFTFVNAHGVTKYPSGDEVGMLAPVCTPDAYDYLLAGSEPLHLGPEIGYW
jgi:GNAT superfamily N-acetyltransferase